MERKLAGKPLYLIVTFVLLLAFGIYLYSYLRPQENPVAEVSVNGAKVMRIELDSVTETKTYTLDNGIVIEATEHSVRIESSPCRDKICVNSGSLSRAGDTAACVPMKTSVVIVGGESDVDVITY